MDPRSQNSNEVTLALQFNIVWAEFVLDICRSILMVPELDNLIEIKIQISFHNLTNSSRKYARLQVGKSEFFLKGSLTFIATAIIPSSIVYQPELLLSSLEPQRK